MKTTEHNSTIPPEHQPDTPTSIDPEIEAQVRHRAYQLYEQRGEGPGDPMSDWLEAEQEVRAAYDLQKMKAAA